MTEGVFGCQSGHEQVVFCQDARTGLQAIIAVYSTALGPALGGTRFYPYATEQDALADVLALSKGMAYKNALAGLDLGGGKAVIIGNPEDLRSEALLRAYGRFVQSLGGRYITACDVGTGVADMDVIARETDFVTGRSRAHGGAGDPSVFTAYGVFQAMRAAVEHVWGAPDLSGKRIGVAGVGKVGSLLVDHVLQAGAKVVITDLAEEAVTRTCAAYPDVEVASDLATLIRSDLDVFAPCALGRALDDDIVGALSAKVVCGSANNQLAHGEIDRLLAEHGIVLAPDYLVNAGGVIAVSDELRGFDAERAKRTAATLYDTTKAVLALAAEEGVPPLTAADRLAERRMSEVPRLRSIRTG